MECPLFQYLLQFSTLPTDIVLPFRPHPGRNVVENVTGQRTTTLQKRVTPRGAPQHAVDCDESRRRAEKGVGRRARAAGPRRRTGGFRAASPSVVVRTDV
mmetsp:Transcript_3135/g.4643  ORF Transcript_3135/g.4643 Transcript_3135/m.4643 type:complete len:100 (-) Transcript_3135:1605-1904(-)